MGASLRKAMEAAEENADVSAVGKLDATGVGMPDAGELMKAMRNSAMASHAIEEGLELLEASSRVAEEAGDTEYLDALASLMDKLNAMTDDEKEIQVELLKNTALMGMVEGFVLGALYLAMEQRGRRERMRKTPRR